MRLGEFKSIVNTSRVIDRFFFILLIIILLRCHGKCGSLDTINYQRIKLDKKYFLITMWILYTIPTYINEICFFFFCCFIKFQFN